VECEEIYELIQRDLDSDLDDSEKTELMLHLSNCPDCAELAERLHMISTRLEQLPMVKPPFSIVSSILPQLDIIDQERNKSGVPFLAADEQVAAIERKRVDIKRNKMFWYRSAGGFIAAGLLLSVVMFNMGESSQKESALSMPNKYKESNSAGNEAAKPSTAAPSAAAVEKKVEPAHGKPALAENKRVAVIGGQNNSVGTSESSAYPNAAEESAVPSSGQHPDKGQPAGKTQSPEKNSEQTPPPEKNMNKEAPLKGKPGENGGSPLPGNAAKLPEKSAVAVAPKENGGQAAPKEGPALAPPNPGAANGIMSFAGSDNNANTGNEDARQKDNAASGAYRPPGNPSPKGEYFVGESGNQLLVRDKTGQISFATHTWNAAYNVSYRWINDQLIEYTLQYNPEQSPGTPSDLRVQKWIIDLEKNIERPVYK
jgi:hypothetical protein